MAPFLNGACFSWLYCTCFNLSIVEALVAVHRSSAPLSFYFSRSTSSSDTFPRPLSVWNSNFAPAPPPHLSWFYYFPSTNPQLNPRNIPRQLKYISWYYYYVVCVCVCVCVIRGKFPIKLRVWMAIRINFPAIDRNKWMKSCEMVAVGKWAFNWSESSQLSPTHIWLIDFFLSIHFKRRIESIKRIIWLIDSPSSSSAPTRLNSFRQLRCINHQFSFNAATPQTSRIPLLNLELIFIVSLTWNQICSTVTHRAVKSPPLQGKTGH